MLCLTFNAHFHSIYTTLMMNHTHFAFAFVPFLKDIWDQFHFMDHVDGRYHCPQTPSSSPIVQCIKIDLVRERNRAILSPFEKKG